MKPIQNLVFILILSFHTLNSQSLKTTFEDSTFVNLKNAYEIPEKIYKLKLTHQHLNINNINLSAFINLQQLTLSYDSLLNLPEGLQNLKNLKVLDISGNNFKLLPEQLALIPNLEELYLNNEKHLDLNQSFEIINKITHLKRLHLDSIPNFKLPKHLKLNSNIEYLSMRYNNLSLIPPQLRKFKLLKVLDLEGNKLKSINRSFLKNKDIESLVISVDPNFNFKKSFLILSKESNLSSLSLLNSSLSNFPEDLSYLSNISSLSLHNDNLNIFPTGILSMKNLKNLDLSGNNFTNLPSTFLALNKLEKLNLSNDNYLNYSETADLVKYLPSIKLIEVNNYDYIFQPEIYKDFKQSNNYIELFPKKTQNSNIHLFKFLKPANTTSTTIPFNNFNAEGFGIRLGW
jgi:Leucine-rich repeat (LRR) protein